MSWKPAGPVPAGFFHFSRLRAGRMQGAIFENDYVNVFDFFY